MIQQMKISNILEADEINRRFNSIGDSFVIECSFSHLGNNDLFILCASSASLKLLLDHGEVFFMDGMHGVNEYKDNQIVTLNVRVGAKGYPSVYLITDR